MSVLRPKLIYKEVTNYAVLARFLPFLMIQNVDFFLSDEHINVKFEHLKNCNPVNMVEEWDCNPSELFENDKKYTSKEVQSKRRINKNKMTEFYEQGLQTIGDKRTSGLKILGIELNRFFYRPTSAGQPPLWKQKS